MIGILIKATIINMDTKISFNLRIFKLIYLINLFLKE